jgi:putative PEP-CTERM system histidine kinase
VLGLLSYGVAAAASLLLTVLLIVGWKGHPIGARLILASGATSLWALVLAVESSTDQISLPVLYFSELVRGGAWLSALFVLADKVVPRAMYYLAGAIWLVCVGSGLAAISVPSQGSLSITDLWISRLGILTSIAGLLLIQRVLANASTAARRSLRYLAIGLGGALAYDLLMFSQAEIQQEISMAAWIARGAAHAVAVPFIALAARRNPTWSLDIFVSRQAVLYSWWFIAVCIYLLAMALGGFVVRDSGGTWATVGQIMLVVGAVTLLVALVSSAQLRRHVRVFISKHFYRNKYDYRVEWLRFINTLSSAEDTDPRRTAVRAVAQIFASPGAILFTREVGGDRFVPSIGWPMQVDDVPGLVPLRDDSDLVRFLATKQWIIDIPEYRRVPEIYQSIQLPHWLLTASHLRIVSPMLQLEELVGFFVMYDPPAPFELTFEDRDLLKTVGRHVAIQLAQHEADRKLAESRQFETYNRLTAFMMHDLKNSIAQLQLIVANAARHKSNPEFIDDAIATIANTADRITRLIEQISSNGANVRLHSVRMDALVRTAVARCSERQPIPTLDCRLADDVVRADPERLTAVLEHVIRNAQDAASPTSTVVIEAIREREEIVVSVADTGRGMEPDFVRERLFRPFDSTKGAKGMGIGAYQTREYIRMLGGRVEVQSSPGSGTRFSITLPLAQETV